MATRNRKVLNSQTTAFGKSGSDVGSGALTNLLKQGRKSGQVNLSGLSLTTVPNELWRINIDVPEEGKTMSMDNSDNRWWEQNDLTTLILASNLLNSLSEDIVNLPALTVFDVHDNQLVSLPDALGTLQNLQKLDISRNNLTEFPACVGRLQNLKCLLASRNQLASVSEDIGNMIYVEDLDLSNNLLTILPKSIGCLHKVMKLNISNNKIQDLPEEIGNLHALHLLDATHNQLASLPPKLGTLAQLEQLFLRHNRLTHLPTLSACGALKDLHLGNNQIDVITAEHVQCLPAISILDLRDNKITELPVEIAQLQALERLDVSNNNLSGLPNELGQVTTLKSIVLDGNPMRSIRRDIIMRGTQEIKKYLQSRIQTTLTTPSSAIDGVQSNVGQSGVIGAAGGAVNAHDVMQFKFLDYRLMLVCDDLQELNLGFNKLQTIHSDIGLFFRLTTLDLRNNLLSDLPMDMSSLKELREIILSCNRLTKLPLVLYKLAKLEILFVNDNKITSIDVQGCRQLPMLATLDLQNNCISEVPPELGLCEQIKSLQLGGNLFRNPRPAILAKGTNALLEHLRSRIVV